MVSDVAFGYLIQGNLEGMFKWVLNSYFPFLLFWIFLGITIFTVIYVKSNNLSFSTSMVIMYFIVVSQFMIGNDSEYITVINYLTLFLIFFVFFLLYKVYKGST